MAERTQGFQSAGPRGSKEAWQETAWHALALAKLRAYGAALEVLTSVGSLDADSCFAAGVCKAVFSYCSICRDQGSSLLSERL